MLAVSAIVGAYTVATFTSTGLAKLTRHKAASVGLLTEAVVPESLARTTVLCVSALELILAVLFVTTVQVFAVGIFTAVLFLAFGAYRILSTIRTGRISCSCAGSARSRNASLPGILGMLFAALVQSGIACVWAFSPPPHGGTIKVFLALVALIPFTAYGIGIISARRAVSTVHACASGSEWLGRPAQLP
jgi:hypothetical protein